MRRGIGRFVIPRGAGSFSIRNVSWWPPRLITARRWRIGRSPRAQLIPQPSAGVAPVCRCRGPGFRTRRRSAVVCRAESGIPEQRQGASGRQSRHVCRKPAARHLIDNGNGRPWIANAPNAVSGAGSVTVFDPQSDPPAAAQEMVADGVSRAGRATATQASQAV